MGKSFEPIIGKTDRTRLAAAVWLFVIILFWLFLNNAQAQNAPAVRRQPLPGYATDPTHPLHLPPDAIKIVQTNYELDKKPRGWATIWVSRELEGGKANASEKATGLAIYRQIGGDNPPARMLTNVRLKRVFVPFDSPGLEPFLSEQEKQEGMQPALVINLIWRCANQKPCLKETVWLGYPDPEDSPPLADSSLLEISANKADASAIVEMWRKK